MQCFCQVNLNEKKKKSCKLNITGKQFVRRGFILKGSYSLSPAIKIIPGSVLSIYLHLLLQNKTWKRSPKIPFGVFWIPFKARSSFFSRIVFWTGFLFEVVYVLLDIHLNSVLSKTGTFWHRYIPPMPTFWSFLQSYKIFEINSRHGLYRMYLYLYLLRCWMLYSYTPPPSQLEGCWLQEEFCLTGHAAHRQTDG